MIAHKRYLKFRNERLEGKNRWLTILASTLVIVVLIAIIAGSALLRIADDEQVRAEPEASSDVIR